jgi:hypothetical protein
MPALHKLRSSTDRVERTPADVRHELTIHQFNFHDFNFDEFNFHEFNFG